MIVIYKDGKFWEPAFIEGDTVTLQRRAITQSRYWERPHETLEMSLTETANELLDYLTLGGKDGTRVVSPLALVLKEILNQAEVKDGETA